MVYLSFFHKCTIPKQRLGLGDLFSDKNETKINIKKIKNHLVSRGLLTTAAAKYLMTEASKIMEKETNLLKIEPPLYIFGDIHGQFFDLLKLLKKVDMKKKKLLFLGDYVDRGAFSVEVLLYLCALKCRYPENIYMLRGNHESKRMNKAFTFRSECEFKLNVTCHDVACDLFNHMPLAALVHDRLLCLHGCISPKLQYVDEIQEINRFQEIPTSDPTNNRKHSQYFQPNPKRNISFLVGKRAIYEFLKRNDLLAIIRGHQVPRNGYEKVISPLKGQSIPAVLTLFSAPNYCDKIGNKAGIAFYNGKALRLIQVSEAEHPYVLPNFLSCFSLQLSFVMSETEIVLSRLTARDSQKRKSDVRTRLDNIIKHSESLMNAGSLTPLGEIPTEPSQQMQELSDFLQNKPDFKKIRQFIALDEKWQ